MIFLHRLCVNISVIGFVYISIGLIPRINSVFFYINDSIMNPLIVGLIIFMILLIVLFNNPVQENMTRIFRGVGVANDADEQPVAAGVISSMPLADYTYTYFDGKKLESCDLCPNAVVCPKCPQFSSEKFQNLPSEAMSGKCKTGSGKYCSQPAPPVERFCAERMPEEVKDILYTSAMGMSVDNDVIRYDGEQGELIGINGYAYKI
jgi:hypothetical protein